MIALSGPLLILPIAAGLLTRWLTPATICSVGLIISAAGLFWLAHVPVGSDHIDLIAPLMTIGIGISLPWGLMDGLAVSAVLSGASDIVLVQAYGSAFSTLLWVLTAVTVVTAIIVFISMPGVGNGEDEEGVEESMAA